MSFHNWFGGENEIRALAKIHKFNVIIHEYGGPIKEFFYHKPADLIPVIHLSFHMGELYNSIRRVDDDLKKGEPPILECAVGYDLFHLMTEYGTQGMEFAERTEELEVDSVKDYPVLPEVMEYAISRVRENADPELM